MSLLLTHILFVEALPHLQFNIISKSFFHVLCLFLQYHSFHTKNCSVQPK